MSGRFYLSVTYDEPDPLYVEPPIQFDHYGDRDRRSPEQREPRTSRTVMTCELTDDQWQLLKLDMLNRWDPRQDGRRAVAEGQPVEPAQATSAA